MIVSTAGDSVTNHNPWEVNNTDLRNQGKVLATTTVGETIQIIRIFFKISTDTDKGGNLIIGIVSKTFTEIKAIRVEAGGETASINTTGEEGSIAT